MKRLIIKIAVAVCLTVWLAAAFLLAENAVRIPTSLRFVDPTPPGATIRSRDGIELKAWIQEPAANANGRAVLLLHGITDTHRGIRGVADMLARHGYRTLAPDARGHGASGDAFLTYGLREREDVRAWVDWMESNWKPQAVYGLGASIGSRLPVRRATTVIRFARSY